jgi:hypothetical protein
MLPAIQKYEVRSQTSDFRLLTSAYEAATEF